MGCAPLRPTRALLAACCLGLLPQAPAKYSSGGFQLDAGGYDSGPEYEIAKFSFNEGTAHISGKFRYKAADSNWMTSPAVYLFHDDSWDAYHKLLACEDKVEHAHSLVQIGKVKLPSSYVRPFARCASKRSDREHC
jgi:hypothetical protein